MSASLRNQSFPVATARGWDQSALVRTTNLSVAVGPFDSTQLKMVPREDEVSWGSDAPAGAGTVSGTTVRLGVGAGGWGAVVADADDVCSVRCPLHAASRTYAATRVTLEIINTSIGRRTIFLKSTLDRIARASCLVEMVRLR